LAGPTEAAGIVNNNDNIVVGAIAHCHAVGTTVRLPSSTNPTQEPIPARNRTEETQAFGPPQRQRKTRATKKCCNCARNATCQSKAPRGHLKCSCLLPGRKCTDCACFWQCKNKRNMLPVAARDRINDSTLRAFFPPPAASANPTGDLSQPPASHGAVAAAPTARSRPTTKPTASDISQDDDDDGAARPAGPRADEEPPAGAAGDPDGDDGNLFVPPLPEDHLAEPEAVEEESPDRLQKDPGAGLPGFVPAPVDHLPEVGYRNWPHHNDGVT
jgi:hypothetical protein